MSNEADTCRKFIVPRLQTAGWDTAPCAINEQRSFTDGRVLFVGGVAKRGKRKRADYILRYRPDYPIAVVEAKAEYQSAQDGVQQARDYAEVLGLRFAYASNGREIIEIDLVAGVEVGREDFPTPAELWQRHREALGLPNAETETKLLTSGYPDAERPLRYYQEIAVNRALEAILAGRQRALLNLCTGAGKTAVAFQLSWRLWAAGWNKRGDHRKPKILFLADRNILVDDPKDKTFAPFGDARWKIGAGQAIHSRDIYFSTYQAIAEDERRAGLYREYTRDFFDLIIIDECHRGSSRADGSWREILEWFEPAYQLGMTATPLREESRDTYAYFGEALYTYSLAQGIADGFLAPYRVHRIVTDLDAAGWRPTAGELDRYGRAVPDEEYQTKDFERVVALRARTDAIARHLTDFLKNTDRFAKTIIFCVDQDHASEMRQALVNLNSDLVARYPDYVARVTADEGDIGKGKLSRFQDLEAETPVILTTSQLLTTGVDAPTCKNVVLARVVGSMAEFKQIIGRGTRLREDYGKLWFNIIDYTGTATEKFADPAFDGDPVAEVRIEIDPSGEVVTSETEDHEQAEEQEEANGPTELPPDDNDVLPRKLYIDGGQVEVVAHLVYDLDTEGKRLTCRRLTDWTGEKVRTLFATPAAFRAEWALPDKRASVIEALADRGIDLHALQADAERPDDDPFDLLCHLAWNAPLLTRAERAQRLRVAKSDLFTRYGEDARAVLDALLDKYAGSGPDQLALPQALKVQPVSDFGNPSEIARRFGGPQAMRKAVAELTQALYAA
ncbi:MULTISPECIES: EcoAI/FtnUII family type I restriction enzme subunit R [unclassified Brevundimonas]|uniref:EcoAI/FtnUII family type I restriction enzme subunit R n=1 Tax=unclassified Brevundimonas TaxID=2622653 RepID=UPI0006F2B8B2|nr:MULTISPECIES: DEAD/DEAH box helicase family protein [unclassified Brevundimonas]KQY95058.1 DEAD/DEAH box helicase [Brevundimonas sp. Root1423]KRA28545.1 DEAD/DEAH box helicase [Brevundimonas sp. Root608]